MSFITHRVFVFRVESGFNYDSLPPLCNKNDNLYTETTEISSISSHDNVKQNKDKKR